MKFAGGQTDRQTGHLLIMLSFYAPYAKNAKIHIILEQFFVHLCDISKHYYSCKVTSSPVLCCLVLKCSVMFYVLCIHVAFSRGSSSSVSQAHMKTSNQHPSHAYSPYFWKDSFNFH